VPSDAREWCAPEVLNEGGPANYTKFHRMVKIEMRSRDMGVGKAALCRGGAGRMKHQREPGGNAIQAPTQRAQLDEALAGFIGMFVHSLNPSLAAGAFLPARAL